MVQRFRILVCGVAATMESGAKKENQMSEPKTAIEPLSAEDAFYQCEELFAKVFDGIKDQAQDGQLAPEYQLALEQLKTSVERRDKLGNVLIWLDGQAELLRSKEKQLADRRHRLERFAAAVRSSVFQQMIDWGVKKFEGQEFTFAIRQNPPKVQIVNEQAIPPEFVSYTPTIDRAAIKSALEDGKEVPGAELVRSTRLDVR
jgi:Siphovirus Gp157